MHRDSGAKGTHRLQDVSSETEKASEASSGASSGAVGGTGEGRWLAGDWGDGADWGSGGWDDWSNNWDSGVDVDWSSWDNWLGDGAWAVGDGESGGLSDGVGNIVEGQGGWPRAVGGEGSVDLSDPGDVASSGSDGSHKGGGDGGDRELHLDGLDWYYLL